MSTMALTSSRAMASPYFSQSPAKTASAPDGNTTGPSGRGNKSKSTGGEEGKLAGFTGGVQGVHWRVAHGDERHPVCAHLHCHLHHRPCRHDRPSWLFAGSQRAAVQLSASD